MALKGQPFKKIFGILKTVAPLAIPALTGPAAPIAAGIIKKVMGDTTMTDDKLVDAITAAASDPDQLSKLRQIQADLEKHEADTGVRFVELDAQDRADARAREVSLKDPTTRVLAFTIVGAFITIIVGVLLGYAHVESALAGTLVGYISAKTEQVVAYYFGSSAGSKSKDATIASIGGK